MKVESKHLEYQGFERKKKWLADLPYIRGIEDFTSCFI